MTNSTPADPPLLLSIMISLSDVFLSFFFWRWKALYSSRGIRVLRAAVAAVMSMGVDGARG
jgi:hypothetical protein